MKERDSYIDFCRGIAVLDVLGAHTAFWVLFWETPNFAKSAFLFFEVPMFFFLSGWAMSLGIHDFKRALNGVKRFWLQWIYFVVVTAALCAISMHTSHPIEGVAGLSDLISNIFFDVSFPGLPVIGVSLWWILSFFVLIPLFSLILMPAQDKKYKAAVEVGLLIATVVLFFVMSLTGAKLPRGIFTNDWLVDLNIMSGQEFDATLPLLGTLWLLGVNKKRIKPDKLWKFLVPEAVIILLYIVSDRLYGISVTDVQSAKFPPVAPYLFASLIFVLPVLYFEGKIKKTGKLLPHIGKNAPFYFFAQGVTSSLCNRIKGFIPEWGWAPRLIILLVINIFLAIAFAEALAFSYGLIRRAVMMLKEKKVLRISKFSFYTIAIFFMVMLFFELVNDPGPFGEWDDYSFPIVSIIEEGRISVTDKTIESVKEWLFPGWDFFTNDYILSGMYTPDGGQLPWYFPVYGIFCMPLVLLFRLFGIHPVHAFPLTNLLVMTAALIFTAVCLKTDEKKRNLIVLLLAVHPIVFYISNISAEVLIFALLVCCLTAWHNKWYKTAAIFVSLAGMMNPTILVTGLIMIAEYMAGPIGQVVSNIKEKKAGGILKGVNILQIFIYALCFVPALVPMAYNFYYTGHINLTAATKSLVTGTESNLQRMGAYLTDLNYGMLVYFPVLFVIAAALLVVAVVVIVKSFVGGLRGRAGSAEAREGSLTAVRFLLRMAAFFINLFAVSLVTHINCGMCGISRYNAWLSVLPIFAIVMYGREICSSVRVALAIGALYTGILIALYYPHFAMNQQYINLSPIAEKVLDEAPALYNPLPSTFVSRTTHVDGGYEYDTPIYYTAEDGYVRKILATKEDVSYIKEHFTPAPEKATDFENKLARLTEKPTYISLPKSYKVCYNK